MTMMSASSLHSPHPTELSEADLGSVAGGFTLIELLVTIKVIAVEIALLIPPIQKNPHNHP